MPRIFLAATEITEKAVANLFSELGKNKVTGHNPMERYEYPGRVRFLHKNWVKKQIWKHHVDSIMDNFEKLSAHREQIRRRLQQQRNRQ